MVIGAGDALDPYCAWPAISETEEAGALLVRPDGVVAWCVQANVSDRAQAANLLQDALHRILKVGQRAPRPSKRQTTSTGN